MVKIVNTIDAVINDRDAMRSRELALAPSIQKVAISVENDDRVITAIEEVHAVLRVGGNGAYLGEFSAIWIQTPTFHRRESHAFFLRVTPVLQYLWSCIITCTTSEKETDSHE